MSESEHPVSTAGSQPTKALIVFALRRIGEALLVLFGVSILIFVLARVIPGDPARLALGPAAPPDQVEALRQRLGLDKPLPLQYGRYLSDALRGELGMSLYTSRPVAIDLIETFPATLELVVTSTFILSVFGVALGVTAGMRRGSWIDRLAHSVSIMGVTTPTFVWAVALMLVFGYWSGWFPIGGRLSEWLLPPPRVTGLYTIDAVLAGEWSKWASSIHHLILPATALSLPALGQTARLTRTSMMEVAASRHIEFARASAIPERTIAWRYALRPASIPVLTIIGLEFVALFGNAFLVETVFMWPGMARYGVETILYKDLNGMMASILVLTLLLVVVNATVDVLTAVIDPRIRTGAAKP